MKRRPYLDEPSVTWVVLVAVIGTALVLAIGVFFWVPLVDYVLRWWGLL